MPRGEPFGSSSEPVAKKSTKPLLGVRAKHAFRPKYIPKPPPQRTPEQHEQAVGLMEERAEKGLDIWTGEPIHSEN